MKQEKQEEKMKEIKQKRYRNENEYNDISIKEKIKGKNKQNGENIITINELKNGLNPLLPLQYLIPEIENKKSSNILKGTIQKIKKRKL